MPTPDPAGVDGTGGSRSIGGRRPRGVSRLITRLAVRTPVPQPMGTGWGQGSAETMGQ
jgi:hypothetical protein